MRRALPILCLTLLATCAEEQNPATGPHPDPAQTFCTLDLRSWRVLAQGRHLYLDCDCPPPFAHLSGRVEFTSAALRTDFSPAAAADLIAANPDWSPPIARMSRGTHLAPFIATPDDRLEQSYTAPASAVLTLQQDRIFANPYRLLGPNSNSALRAAMTDAGIPLPHHILASGGILGAFPGIAQSPGPTLPPDRWPRAALPGGPTPIPPPIP